MSVPTVDEEAWRTLEPGTAHPLQRLRAVRELVDAGVNAGVLMAPIVPGFSSSRAKLERTIKAIADHGARFVGCNVMFLQDGTRTHFMKFIEREFPSMAAALREAVREEVPRRRTIGSRSRGWCACCRSATASHAGSESRTKKSQAKRNRSASPGEAASRSGSRWSGWFRSGFGRSRPEPSLNRLTRRRRRRARRPATPSWRPPARRRARRPSTLTSKCVPSFQLRADRQLDLLVDDALQEARAEGHAVALRHHQLERLVGRRRSSCPPSPASASPASR